MGSWRNGMPRNEIAVAAAFFVAAFASITLVRSTGLSSMVWPANAIAAALLVRMPTVRWAVVVPAIAVAGILANLLSAHDPLGWAGAMTAVNLAEVCGTAWIFRSWIRYPLPHINFDQGVRMASIFVFVVPSLTAIPGGWIVHNEFGAPELTATLNWWRSGAIGSCLCAPAIYLYSDRTARRIVSRRFLLENLALTLACLASTCLAICVLRFPFVVMEVPLIIAAFSAGSFGAAVVSGLCGLVVVGLWSFGLHPTGLEMLGAESDAAIRGLPFLALVATILPPVAVGLATDQRRHATRALRFSERQFRTSVAHSPIGIIISDLNGTWTVANAAMRAMLGFDEHELESIHWMDLTHPDDHEDIAARREKLLKGELDSYEADRRYLTKRGEWIWIRVAVSLVRDDEGRPLHFMRQVESINERRRAERELSDERQRLRTTLQAIADAVITTDGQGNITYINAAAIDLLGQPPEALQGRSFFDVVPTTDPRTSRKNEMVLRKCLASGQTVRRPEAVLLHRPDGGIRYVSKVASPLFGEGSSVNGAVVVLRDASIEYERNRKLNHLASHDVLTGLCNRFEFERRLQVLFDRSKVLILPATLIAVDLDHFKAVNDSGGHAAGDAVLRRVAEVLKACVRSGDTVARVGGDEFAIVLEKATPERARDIAHKIQSALNPLQIEWQRQTYAVGASFGVATIADEYESIAAWMAAADAACYDAKRTQRGQVHFAA